MSDKNIDETKATKIVKTVIWIVLMLYGLLFVSKRGYIIDLGFLPPYRVNLFFSWVFRVMSIYGLVIGILYIKKEIIGSTSGQTNKPMDDKVDPQD